MLAAFSARPASAQHQPAGLFDGQADVGQVEVSGTTTYDAETQEYVLEGAGANMWNDRDAFHFAWKRLRGDFILRAQAEFLEDEGPPHRKLGWVVRSSLDAGAAYVSAAVHADGLTSMQLGALRATARAKNAHLSARPASFSWNARGIPTPCP